MVIFFSFRSGLFSWLKSRKLYFDFNVCVYIAIAFCVYNDCVCNPIIKFVYVINIVG